MIEGALVGVPVGVKDGRGLGVLVIVAVGVTGVKVNVGVKVGMVGVSVIVLVKVGILMVTSCTGMTVPGC